VSTDQQTLRALNIAINDAENTGDKGFLESILAAELAFSRASGVMDDARRFLEKVAVKDPPGELRPRNVSMTLRHLGQIV